MNSLRDIVRSSPQLRGIETKAMYTLQGEDASRPLGPARWNWQEVRKVLLVRLRSIGDTVLATPHFQASSGFFPLPRFAFLVEHGAARCRANNPLLNG